MIKVWEKVAHLVDAIELNDVRKINSTDGYEFWLFEKDRLMSLKSYLGASIELCELSSETQLTVKERLI